MQIHVACDNVGGLGEHVTCHLFGFRCGSQLASHCMHWRIQGGPAGAMAPLAAWASTQNALKVAIFKLKIEKIFWGGAMPPPQNPASFPLHKFNHNVVSNTLVLSSRAICIHTTASFPTSNGFLRLKRFKQSM